MNWSAIWAGIQPLAKSAALELWSQVVYPELQKLDAEISQADLKLVGQAALIALSQVVAGELAPAVVAAPVEPVPAV